MKRYVLAGLAILLAAAPERAVASDGASVSISTSGGVTFPAANPAVFAVTAADRDGSIASYANRGSFIDLIAPGTTFMNYDGLTYRVTGTSPATAIVSGAAATFASNCQGQDQTIQQIQQTFGFQQQPKQ